MPSPEVVPEGGTAQVPLAEASAPSKAEALTPGRQAGRLRSKPPAPLQPGRVNPVQQNAGDSQDSEVGVAERETTITRVWEQGRLRLASPETITLEELDGQLPDVEANALPKMAQAENVDSPAPKVDLPMEAQSATVDSSDEESAELSPQQLQQPAEQQLPPAQPEPDSDSGSSNLPFNLPSSTSAVAASPERVSPTITLDPLPVEGQTSDEEPPPPPERLEGWKRSDSDNSEARASHLPQGRASRCLPIVHVANLPRRSESFVFIEEAKASQQEKYVVKPVFAGADETCPERSRKRRKGDSRGASC